MTAVRWWETDLSKVSFLPSRLHERDLVASLKSQKERTMQVKKVGIQFLVFADDGEVLGRHVTKPEAESHLEELEKAAEAAKLGMVDSPAPAEAPAEPSPAAADSLIASALEETEQKGFKSKKR